VISFGHLSDFARSLQWFLSEVPVFSCCHHCLSCFSPCLFLYISPLCRHVFVNMFVCHAPLHCFVMTPIAHRKHLGNMKKRQVDYGIQKGPGKDLYRALA